MPKCENCKSDFNNWAEIDGVKKNISRRKYCLNCSPFGSHNTRKIHDQQKNETEKQCLTCKIIKPLNEFSKRNNGMNLTGNCKACLHSYNLNRQKLFKMKCVEYKGGKCEICGYNSSLEALEFHHTDKSDKNFSISKKKSCSLKTVKEELDKCKLICSNCHREEHFKNRSQQS